MKEILSFGYCKYWSTSDDDLPVSHFFFDGLNFWADASPLGRYATIIAPQE